MLLRKKLAAIATTALLGLTFAASAHAAPYTVQSGDYLWKIAATQGISVEKLKALNHLTGDSLLVGQVLQLPNLANDYVVKPGDTLWIISQKFGLELNSLIAANPQITNPANIWPGIVLHIPQQPAAYANGLFPLAAGTYQNFVNNYAEARYWTPQGVEVRQHEGVDIFAAKGTPIYSALGGTITNFGWNELGGWRVTIQVDATTSFYYAHLSKYAAGLGKGSVVTRGQLLGYVGDTGYGPEGTTGNFLPHLHCGIYKTGPWRSIDPFPYLTWWQLQAK